MGHDCDQHLLLSTPFLVKAETLNPGEGRTMELALTARTFSAAEAKAMGLVTEVCDDVEAVEARAMQLAASIACKSPIAVTGTKRVLQNARCHPPPPIPFTKHWLEFPLLSLC